MSYVCQFFMKELKDLERDVLYKVKAILYFIPHKTSRKTPKLKTVLLEKEFTNTTTATWTFRFSGNLNESYFSIELYKIIDVEKKKIFGGIKVVKEDELEGKVKLILKNVESEMTFLDTDIDESVIKGKMSYKLVVKTKDDDKIDNMKVGETYYKLFACSLNSLENTIRNIEKSNESAMRWIKYYEKKVDVMNITHANSMYVGKSSHIDREACTISIVTVYYKKKEEEKKDEITVINEDVPEFIEGEIGDCNGIDAIPYFQPESNNNLKS